MNEFSEEQRNAYSALSFWFACVEATRTMDGEEALANDAPILYFCRNGTSAMVTAGQLRTILK